MLAREVTPSVIVRYLDQYVIGQENAKRIVAVAVYTHYRKIASAAPGIVRGASMSSMRSSHCPSCARASR